jgi:hypothetical protein
MVEGEGESVLVVLAGGGGVGEGGVGAGLPVPVAGLMGEGEGLLVVVALLLAAEAEVGGAEAGQRLGLTCRVAGDWRASARAGSAMASAAQMRPKSALASCCRGHRRWRRATVAMSADGSVSPGKTALSVSTGITTAPAANASASSRRTQSPGSSFRRRPSALQTLGERGPITATLLGARR